MFKNLTNLLVVVLVICIFSSSAISAPPAGYSKVWEDTFSGTSLDTANWTVGCKDPGTGDIIPGAAGAYLLNTGYAGYITAEDVWVANGSLYLQNQQRSYTGTDPAGSYDYTTGWIMSMHKVYYNKGYFEMRAQFPSGDKVWPAYWLIAEDLIWGPEWDVFEYFGYRSDHGYDVMGMNLAYGSYPNINWITNWIYGYDATYDCEAWHVYGWEWGPDSATWYIDGVEVAYMQNTIGDNWPNEDMYIVLNNGVKTDSPDTNTTWPNYLIVDYIEVYQSDAVCGNGTCEPGEGCSSCSDDCISKTKGNPNSRYCCGDGICENEENETNCAVDCGGGGPVCDDGTCDPGEDECNCPQDCGTPPSTETNCTDGIDEDCDTYTDCDDSDCDGDPACPTCGDQTCDPGEDQCNCAVDCGTPPATETNCTDGIDEDCDTYMDCADADCAGDPACQAIYTDGFESGDLVAGDWTVSGGGSVNVKSRAAYTGSYGAEIRGVVSMETAIDTSGLSNIHIKYVCRTKGLDPEEELTVDWYDGSSWHIVNQPRVTSWTAFEDICGSGADDNPSFKIRFSLDSNHASGEWVRLDDVEVIGG